MRERVIVINPPLPRALMIALLIVGFLLLMGIFLLNFYRDPQRIPPPDSVCISPADGKIMSIVPLSTFEHVIKKGHIGRVKTRTRGLDPKSTVISIFMSPLDVHINRMPINGTIVSVKHHPGPFGMAFAKERSWQNERSEIAIKTRYGIVKVFQIAGFLARRIQTWVKPRQTLALGERIGRIVLGSQVTIILPSKLLPAVRVGQRVYAGVTSIAVVIQ